MKPIVYSSEDVGAPQIFMTKGAIKAAIKTCLITGYGNKSPAGWEILHDDLVGNAMALRSTSIQSIKSVFVIKDNNAANGIVIDAYLDWDLASNTGVSKYTTRYGISNRDKESRPVGNAQKWTIIANDKFCWFWLATNDKGSYGILHAFGDVLTVAKEDGISAVLAYPTGLYLPGNADITSVATSKGAARISSLPFPTNQASALGSTSKANDSYKTDIHIFSKQLVYLPGANGAHHPAFFIPGLLMPWMDANEIPIVNGLMLLHDQDGFTNPIVALIQNWQGAVFFSTDDWS